MAPTITDRPDMAGYGVEDDLDGVLPWTWAVERLVGSRSYWVVTVSGDGRPHAMPVWGVWCSDEDDYWFSCAPTARKVRNLAANDRVTPERAFGIIETPEDFARRATRWRWT